MLRRVVPRFGYFLFLHICPDALWLRFYSGKSIWRPCKLLNSSSIYLRSILAVCRHLWYESRQLSHPLLLAYSHFVHTYWKRSSYPCLGNCAGTESAALLGCGVLTSYLGLFIKFYIQTYKRPASSRKPNGVANGSANGHVNGYALVLQVSSQSRPRWRLKQQKVVMGTIGMTNPMNFRSDQRNVNPVDISLSHYYSF